MSTDFGTVRGLDLPNSGNGLRREIYVTRFYGGPDHGPCVQLTISGQYVQLDREAVKELRKKLKKAYS